MAIKYYLQKNRLSSKPDAHAAHILSETSLYEEDIIWEMAGRGSSLSESELKAFFVLLNQVVGEELVKGHSVKLSFASIRLSVSGYFNGPSDQFRPESHKVKASLTSGPELKNILKTAVPVKVSKPVQVPSPGDFTDIRTNSRNGIISPTGMGVISGSGLKFRPDNHHQGIFFISEEGNLTVKTELFASITDKKLTFQIPELPPSTRWQLLIKVAYGRSASIIRTGILQYSLYTE